MTVHHFLYLDRIKMKNFKNMLIFQSSWMNKYRQLISGILSMAAGAGWWGTHTIGLILLFPAALILSRTVFDGTLASFLYYLMIVAPTPWALSYEITHAGVVGGWPYWRGMAEGVGLTLGLIAIISITWGLAMRRGTGNAMMRPLGFVAVSTVFPLFHSLYFYGVGSPVLVSGILFKGFGFVGIIVLFLLMAGIELTREGRKKTGLAVVSGCLLIAVLSNGIALKNDGKIQATDHEIVSENTSYDSEKLTPGDVFKEYSRAFHDLGEGAKIVVFPENAMGLNGSFTLKKLVDLTNKSVHRFGRTMLIGEPRTTGSRDENGILVMGSDEPIWIGTTVTMPIVTSGIVPNIKTYVDGGTPEREVIEAGGKRLILSVCYEEILTGLQMDKIWIATKTRRTDAPVMISLSSNRGFPEFLANAQENSARLIADMFALPLYRAVNR